jgi:hypothetical protein
LFSTTAPASSPAGHPQRSRSVTAVACKPSPTLTDQPLVATRRVAADDRMPRGDLLPAPAHAAQADPQPHVPTNVTTGSAIAIRNGRLNCSSVYGIGPSTFSYRHHQW